MHGRLFITLFFLCAIAPVSATTLIKLSDRALTHGADLIAVGKCQKVYSKWVGKELVTVTEVALRDVYKGSSGPSTVTVVTPGGIDAKHNPPIARIYPGSAQLPMGQDVFLFLRRIPDGPNDPDSNNNYQIMGFSQGAFSIVKAADGQPMVVRNLHGARLLSDQRVEPGRSDATPLVEFRRRITQFIE